MFNKCRCHGYCDSELLVYMYCLTHSGYSVHSGWDYKAGERASVLGHVEIYALGFMTTNQRNCENLLKYSQQWSPVFQHKKCLPTAVSPWYVSRVKCFKSAEGVPLRVILRTKCLLQKEKLWLSVKPLTVKMTNDFKTQAYSSAVETSPIARGRQIQEAYETILAVIVLKILAVLWSGKFYFLFA